MEENEISVEAREVERVRFLCELGKFDEAVVLARQVAAKTPDNSEPWCLLAQSLLEIGDYVGALDAATRAASLAPEDEWPHRLRSIALSESGRTVDALSAAIESVRCAPFSWPTHARVAAISTDLGLKAQAEMAASKALELGPHASDAWTTAAWVAVAGGDRSTGLARYRRALQLNPHNAQAHAGLAQAQLHGRGAISVKNLATSASGFGTAVGTDPRSGHHRDGVDVLLRVFLARAAYLIFLVSYAVDRWSSNSSSLPARFLPVAVLVIPAVFVQRFLVNLSLQVRTHLLRTVRQGLVAIAAAADLLAVAALLTGALLPRQDRPTTALISILGALCARLVLIKELRNKVPQATAQPLRGRAVSWALAICVGVTGAFMAASSIALHGGRGAVIFGGACVTFGVALATYLSHNRHKGLQAR